MKILITSLVVMFSSVIISGCTTHQTTSTPQDTEDFPTATLPDLVIESVVVIGEPTIDSSGSIDKVAVPIRVVVKNQGLESAGTFSVGTEIAEIADTPKNARFTVQGQSNAIFPSTSSQLAAGSTVVFSGTLNFIGNYHLGQTVPMRIYAIADTCLVDELLPEYCMVREINENNNRSSGTSFVWSMPERLTLTP